MASYEDLIKFSEGDKIKFIHYSSISPRPVCIGTVEQVWGMTLRHILARTYEMDVRINKVLSPDWAKKDLEGHKTRIMVRPDAESSGDIQKLSPEEYEKYMNS